MPSSESTQESVPFDYLNFLLGKGATEDDAACCAKFMAVQVARGSHAVVMTEEDKAALSRVNRLVGNWSPSSNYPDPRLNNK